MQPSRVIRRVKAKAECSVELDPGNKHELPIFATPSCASAPQPISRQSKKEMDKFGGKFLQHQRFSCCDPWEGGHHAHASSPACSGSQHKVLRIWLQPILLPAHSHSPPQTPVRGVGEKTATATTSAAQKWSVHHCPAPASVCLAPGSLPSRNVTWGPRGLNVVGRKGRKAASTPGDRQDGATCPKS